MFKMRSIGAGALTSFLLLQRGVAETRLLREKV
jgi:hypothetical protein